MHRRTSRDYPKARTGAPYVTAEISAVIERMLAGNGDEALARGVHFGPTAMTFIKRLLFSGGTIITDTYLLAEEIDRSLLGASGAAIQCFIDEPSVLSLAEIRRATRAEVAVDHALTLHGPKLMVVGSAPAAISRLLQHRQSEPMTDVCALTALTGFASAVQLKEQLWESDLSSIVLRGKKGGVSATAALLNAILAVLNGR